MKRILIAVMALLLLAPECFAGSVQEQLKGVIRHRATAPAGYSDAFTDTNATALATHNGNWADCGTTYVVANVQIQGNTAQATTGYGFGGARYTLSSSDTSQVVSKAVAAGDVYKAAAVRCSASSSGYAVYLFNKSDGNWDTVRVFKNGSAFATLTSGAAIPANQDHTLKIVVSGTSTVTIEGFVDGVSKGTTSDSSSPIGAGNPGFLIYSDGSIENGAMDDWQDN